MTKLVDQDANRTIEEDNIVPPPMYHENGPPQVLTADTARQAPLGKPVFWVLVGGVVLVVVAFAAVWLFAGAPPAH